MNSDEFRPIRERALDLQFGNHLRHAGHDIFLLEERSAMAHEVRHRAPITNAFQNRGSNKRDRLRMIQLQSARFAFLGQIRRDIDKKLLLFSRCQMPGRSSI